MTALNTAIQSTPKYKVGDRVRADRGWDREVIVVITITTVSANHGAVGAHRYWGAEDRGAEHGAYEDQIRGYAPAKNPCCGNIGTHGEGGREFCSTCGQEIVK